jgi:hypothetical protein
MCLHKLGYVEVVFEEARNKNYALRIAFAIILWFLEC